MLKKTISIACTLSLLISLVVINPANVYATETNLYVSTTGNDTNPGTLSQPFLTIGKARDYIRTINSNMTGNINVYIRGGTYILPSTLSFATQDSGTNGYSIKYMNYPDESPVISGGQQVSGWTLDSNGIYKTYVGTTLQARQLYVNGIRAQRAKGAEVAYGFTENSNGYSYMRVENLWKFENDCTDSSGNGSNGTGYNTTFVTGKIGSYSANFNGTNSYIAVSSSSYTTFGSPSNAFTIGVWVKTTQANRMFLSKGRNNSTSNIDYQLGTNANGKLKFWSWNNSAGVSQTFEDADGTVINDGNWHYVAFANEGASSHKLYVDGVLVENNTTSWTNNNSNTEDLDMGRYKNAIYGTTYFAGQLDDLRIYKKALTESEIGHIIWNRETYPTLSTWGNISDIEIVTTPRSWQRTRIGIDNISSDQVNMKQPAFSYLYDDTDRNKLITWIENAYELLDSQGEWYLNRSTGYIYYKPRTGEDLSTAEVIVPTLETLISGAGDSLDSKIHNIELNGLTFKYNTWLRANSSSGYVSLQGGVMQNGTASWWDQLKTPAAVNFSVASNILVKNCNFSKIGNTGLGFDFGSQNIDISNNSFSDISASGISVGGIDKNYDHIPTDARRIVKNIEIYNNTITKIGVEYPDNVGIFEGYVQYTNIHHNTIYDVSYSGISVGWGWGSGDWNSYCVYNDNTICRNNVIANNKIYDFMKGLYDGGGIYTLGNQPNSTIYNNYIYGMKGDYAAIYLDNGTGNYKVSGNAVSSKDSSCLKWINASNPNGGGWSLDTHDNIVRDNYYSSELGILNFNYSFNTETNNTAVSNFNWSNAALGTINNAGANKGFGDMPTTSSFKFEGNSNDSSVYGNNGAGYNVSYVSGKMGSSAISFNGTNGYVSVPHSTSLNLNFGAPSNKFTISVWVKTTQASRMFLSKGRDNTTSNIDYQLGLSSAGKLKFWSWSQSAGVANTLEDADGTAINDGNWHLVTFVNEGANSHKLYADGVLVEENTSTWTYNCSNAEPLEFGRFKNATYGTTYFSGQLDDSKTFNRALIPSEIKNLFDTKTVEGVILDKATLPLSVGVWDALIPSFTPIGKVNSSVYWSSSNTNVATVDFNGVVTAVSEGISVITATTADGGLTDTCDVRVYARNTGSNMLSNNGFESGITGWTEYLLSGGGVTTAEYYSGAKSYKYSPTVGYAHIRQTGDLIQNKYYYFSAYVKAETNDITNGDALLSFMDDGESTYPTITTYTSNVSDGWKKVEGIYKHTLENKSGSNICIRPTKTAGNIAYIDDVFFGEIIPPVVVTGVALDKSSLIVGKSYQSQLTVTVSPSNADLQDVIWSSSNTSVATISTSGLVSGVNMGIVTITVTTVDRGYVASCTVSVYGDNILSNPNFDYSGGGWSTYDPNNYSTTYWTAEKYEGTGCMRLAPNGYSNGQQTINLVNGQKYYFSAYMKANTSDASGGKIMFYDGSSYYTLNSTLFSISMTDGWKKIEYTYTYTGPTTSTGKLIIQPMNSSGWVTLIDKVELATMNS